MKTLRERFEEKYSVDEKSGCWVWLAGTDKDGYGRIREAGYGSKTLRAHRVSYDTYIGPVPDDMFVCHKCDNPFCVNPGHLFLGSAADNAKDRNEKGRAAGAIGSKHGISKLCESQITEIRKAPGTQKQIADKYGVSQTLISHIKRRVIWRHV